MTRFDPLSLPGHRVAIEPLGHEATLPGLLRALAARFGERLAFAVNARRITYAELESNSARLARGLLASGIGKATRVGILMPGGPDFAEAFFAVARIGALPIPLSTFYAPRELSEILRHADIHTLLVRDRFLRHDYLDKLEAAIAGLAQQSGTVLFAASHPSLRRVWVWGEGARRWAGRGPDELCALADGASGIDESFLEQVESSVAPADLGAMIYTSGTTAGPKGVVHTHGTLVRHAFVLNRYFFPDGHVSEGFYSNMPIFWIGGLVLNTLAVMYSGACIYNEAPLTPEELLNLVAMERIPYLMMWGRQTAEVFQHPRFLDGDFSFVRAGPVDACGDPIPPERIGNSLGMTETAGMHSIEPVNRPLDAANAGSFGRCLPGIGQKIVDPATGEESDEGELWVRGYTLMQGLYKREREDVVERDGYYRTGDRVRRNGEGHIFFEGRLNEMIKARGANVTPREVELVLEAMPEVRRSAVVGLGDPVQGQRVAAAIVLEQGAAIEVADLRARLAEELSSFKVPTEWYFLPENELPMTASDKVRKPELVRRLQEMASEEP